MCKWCERIPPCLYDTCSNEKLSFVVLLDSPQHVCIVFLDGSSSKSFFFPLSSLEIPVWQLKSLVSTLSWRYFNINTHSVDFFFLVLLYVFVLFFIFILQSTFSVFCFLYSVLVPSFFLYFYLISFINFQLFLISFFNQNI